MMFIHNGMGVEKKVNEKGWQVPSFSTVQICPAQDPNMPNWLLLLFQNMTSMSISLSQNVGPS